MFKQAWQGWLTLSISSLLLAALVAGFLWIEQSNTGVLIALVAGGTAALFAGIMSVLAWATPYWRIWGIYEAAAFFGRLGLAAGLIALDRPREAIWVFVIGAVAELAILWRSLDEHWQARMICSGLIAGGNTLLTALLLGWIGQENTAMVLGGVVAMFLAMFGGMLGGLALLQGGRPLIGIARTTMLEAIRSRVGLVFIIILVIFVASRLQSPADDRLDFELIRSLTWSMAAVTVLLGAMTLILSCLTISRDMDAKIAHLTLTKPVSRLEYLLGKWLGLVVLNGVLVLVSGLAIYTLAMVTLSREPTGSPQRAVAQQEVLIARAIRLPAPEPAELLQSLIQSQVDRWRRDMAAQEQMHTDLVPPRLMREFEGTARATWHTVDPLRSRSFVFERLNAAREMDQPIFLRLKPARSRAMEIGDRDSVFLQIFFNGRLKITEDISDIEGALLPGIELKNNAFREIAVPPDMLDDDGRLVVTIYNPSPATGPMSFGSVRFSPDTDLQVLVAVGSFEGNLARGMVIIWFQLGLIAVMGLLAGSFLSFQVAMLFASVITMTGVVRNYLITSITYYVSFPGSADSIGPWLLGFFPALAGRIGDGNLEETLKLIVALIGRVMAELVPSLTAYSPIDAVANGRVVETVDVAMAGLWLWIVWGILIGLIAWWLFARREIAEITV